MAYEWKKNEVDRFTGIPFSKGPRVNLEKDGVKKKFVTQETVDEAWADGWHEPGRPETADDPGETETNTKAYDFEPMKRDDLLECCEVNKVTHDKRWGDRRLRQVLMEHFKHSGDEEENRYTPIMQRENSKGK